MPNITTTRPKPFVFVLIPFDKQFDDIYKFGIKGAAAEVGAYAERLDEQIFNEGMLERIFNQISKADVVIADMTNRNPNVFYEVGYAHALGKIVLLLTKNTDDIPFDLQHRQHIVYGGSIDRLKSELITKLHWAISESLHKKESNILGIFSMYIFNILIPRTGTVEVIPMIDGKTIENILSLPIRIRNDASEATSAVSHVYLFCEPNAPLIPFEYSSAQLVSSDTIVGSTFTFLPQANIPTPLESFSATPIDAQDNLTNQFRLHTTIPELPPGAVETFTIPLMFEKGQYQSDSIYRLRLHSLTSYHDFSFHLKISYQSDSSANIQDPTALNSQ